MFERLRDALSCFLIEHYIHTYIQIYIYIYIYVVKAVPIQAWTGPEGSRKLWFPDFENNGTEWW